MKNILSKKRAVLTMAATLVSIASPIGAAEKLKIFILAGQSNMVGHANPHTAATLYQSGSPRDEALGKMVFKEGSGLSKAKLDAQLVEARKLDELSGGISFDKVKKMEDGPEKKALESQLKKLKDAHEAYKEKASSSCVVSDRVFINAIADGNKKAGKLGIGYGGGGKKIGPEYGFGLSMAEKIDGPILLIKTSWGGKSINYNFRPPSAGPYQLNEKEKAGGKADEIKKNAGLNYRMMNESIRNVLSNLKENHPAYDAEAGYEIAGFVWFQGYNDQFSDEFRDNYKDNMISFIKDIRKEHKVPKMPFVIGVLGTGRTAEKVGGNAVSLGQREAAKAPEFKGNVMSVESYKDYSNFSHEIFSKGWPKHYHEWDSVGSDRPYHYLGSGAFFVRLGDSFANAMADLMVK
ncbi:sialate O-acetylesterase [Akkermansiaceae bacterium]|nr:sialate O-acetylesterase [Akkermansiaceae bacterium]MDA7674402.1 sialate O-acetylesterase [bacterium]MDA7608521.1 sialate O-acetylesterase [Akkermansiaceae bacterium]MDA7659291.1 sialate O-acetylesterase [Akkermansiaceae bacterium]MDA7869100.1 sialate O-acetylesterase [Akkermansiaceae bacterium]